jgi:uncharacterized spore protein YtfJ
MSSAQTHDRTFIERIADVLHAGADSKQIYGEPVERDGTTVIPVARVKWGFGGGGIGRGAVERGGGGGGAQAHATGYITLRDGVAEFHPIRDPHDTAMLVAAGAVGLLVGLVVGRLTR